MATTAAERAEISRRNGSRSKGPTSPDGKRRSSMNARKHGMTARTPVLRTEDPDEFRRRLDGIEAALEPQAELERILVHRVATSAWKLDRADRIEVGRLADAVADAVAE